MKIGIGIIKEAINSKSLNDLTAYLYLKNIAKRGCIFNYTIQGLSKKSGLSRTFIRKHIPSLLDRGWCQIHDGNLIFKKIKTKEEKFNKTIELKYNNLKELREQLYLTLIKQKIAQFDKLKQVNRDLETPTDYSSYKAARAFKKKYFKSGNALNKNDCYGISFFGLKNMFNCSLGNAHRIILQLEKQHLTVHRDNHYYKNTLGLSVNVEQLTNDGSVINTGRCLWKNKMNRYELKVA